LLNRYAASPIALVQVAALPRRVTAVADLQLEPKYLKTYSE
jgi:hypothetical protein